MVDKRTQRRLASRIAGGVFGLLLILAFVWFVRTMMASKATKQERKIEVVQIIRPPPPPPPDQPPPPPEKVQQELPKDVPEPTPEQPQQAPPALGIDAQGGAGSDAFGLAGRPGGSDLIGGTGTAPYAWYTSRISDAVRDKLAASTCAKSAQGSLSVHVLLAADGRVKQIKLASTTGNVRTDACIESALTSLTHMSDPPPLGMPEEVTLKIVSRI